MDKIQPRLMAATSKKYIMDYQIHELGKHSQLTGNILQRHAHVFAL